MMLWILVPLIALTGFWYALWRMSARSRAECFVFSLLGAAFFVAGSTEVLSLFGRIDPVSIRALWSAAALVTVCAAVFVWWRPTRPRLPDGIGSVSWVEAGSMALIALTTGLIAIVSPPNNVDSLTYHMPRIMHWMQQGSVAHFATENLRQLYMAPLAEFCLMHVHLLTGGDRMVNLVQWVAMLGCWAGVVLIVRRLGGDNRAQWFVALLCAATPSGVSQAVTTQNDYVLSFFVVATVYYSLALIERVRWADVVACGAGVGLAAMTKPVAAAWLAPFGIWLIAALLRRNRIRALPILAVLSILTVLPAAPHYARNRALFGTILAPTDEPDVGEYQNENFGVATPYSNMIRNAALHLALPWDAWNGAVVRAVRGAHLRFGIDPDDSRRTWQRTPAFELRFALNEDVAGNFLHLMLLGIMIPGVWIARRRRGRATDRLTAYLVAWAAGALIFSWVFRWQLWNARLHLPWFVLGCPLIACACASMWKGWPRIAAATLLLVSALPWMIGNERRPLVGANSILRLDRTEILFLERPGLRTAYEELVELGVREGAQHVCLVANTRDWEYPFWVLIRERLGADATLHHFGVRNISSHLAGRGSSCDYVMSTRVRADP